MGENLKVEIMKEVRENLKDEIMKEVMETINPKLQSADTQIEAISSRMDTTDSRSLIQTRKQSELEHEVVSMAGRVSSIQSSQLMSEKFMRNITIMSARQHIERYNIIKHMMYCNVSEVTKLHGISVYRHFITVQT